MKFDSRYCWKKGFISTWRVLIYRFWCKTRGRCGRSRPPPPSGGPSSRSAPRRHPARSCRRRSRSGDPSCAPGDPPSTRLYRLARCLTSSPGWSQLPAGRRAGQHLQVIYLFLFSLALGVTTGGRKVSETMSCKSIFKGRQSPEFFFLMQILSVFFILHVT